MKHTLRILCFTALVGAPGPALAQSDSTWRDHSAAAAAANARNDWGEARRQLLEVDRLLGGHPSIAFALARAALRLGDTAQALAQVERVAAMGVFTRSTSDPALDGLRAMPAFRAAAAAIAASASTIGSAQVIATVPDTAAIAEDLAWDAARSRFLVSDVRGHRLMSVGLDGRVALFGEPMAPGWSVLAVGVDAHHAVAWATTVTLPQAEGYAARDSGRAAILQLDLASGSVRRRFDLPAPSRAAPGDLAIAENGDLFVGDGQTGAVRVIRWGRDAVETLVPAGQMRGTQQPAIAPDRLTIFIADYGRGIARIDRTSGTVAWLDHGPDVTLTGIDGLVMRGGDLIAVQNGVNPNRIVRLTLDPAMRAVASAEILLRDTTLAPEPTHVALVGDVLYAIGNAGWNKYGDDGAPNTDIPFAPPRLLRLNIR
jgi:hypothetical protein